MGYIVFLKNGVEHHTKTKTINGSDLNRGDDIGSAYPAFKDAIAKAHPGSDVWTDKARADQYIASYVPVRDESRAAGMLVIGLAINDALARVGEITTGRGVLLVTSTGDVVANSGNAGEDVKGAVKAHVQEVISMPCLGRARYYSFFNCEIKLF
ncbi:hypothetical protein [Salmonella enterica]|nr:hypothetical protein [Salmonella enterica]